MAELAIVGAGYVGLVTAACLSEVGSPGDLRRSGRGETHRLRAGDLPIHEPGLSELVSKSTPRMGVCSSGAITAASPLREVRLHRGPHAIQAKTAPLTSAMFSRPWTRSFRMLESANDHRHQEYGPDRNSGPDCRTGSPC